MSNPGRGQFRHFAYFFLRPLQRAHSTKIGPGPFLSPYLGRFSAKDLNSINHEVTSHYTGDSHFVAFL